MKSQFKIEQTLLKYGERKPLDGLTISILSKQAGINRVTFYKNYRSMDDLIKSVLLKNIFFDPNTSQQTISLESSFSLLIQFVKQYRQFCIHLLQSSYRMMVFEFVQNEVMHYQLSEFNRQDSAGVVQDLDRKVAAKFFAAGITTTFFDWIDGGCQQPITDIYQTTLDLSKGFVDRLIQKKSVR